MNLPNFNKDLQYYKFCLYGFLKNMRFFEPFLLLFLLSKVNGNYTQAMSLYSIRFFTRAILEIPSGVVADALGRKGSLLFAYSVYILSFVFYALGNNYYLLLIPTALFGLGDAFRTGTHKAMILEYLSINGWEQAKTAYYGHTRSWSQAGSALSSVLAATIIIFTNNYNIIFLATIIPYIIGFALIYSYPKELDKRITKGSVWFNLKEAFRKNREAICCLKKVRLLTNTSFYFGFHNACKDLLQPIVVTAMTTLSFFTKIDELHKSAFILGMFYLVIYTISSISSRNAHTAKNIFKSALKTINGLALTGILLCLLIALLNYLDKPMVAAIFFLPFFSILSFQRPNVVALVSDKTDPKIMASTLSIESQLGSVFAALFSLLLGIFVETQGLGIGLGTVSFIALIILSTFKLIPHEKDQPAPA